MATRQLSPRQSRFVGAFLGECDGNASAAAKAAGYPHPYSQGHRVLENVGVRQRIGEAVQSGAMTAEEVVARLSQIAAFDPSGYYDASKEPPAFDLKRLRADGLGFMLKEIIPTARGVQVKFLSAQEALNTLAKFHGLLVERVRIAPDLDELDSLSDDQLRAIASGKPWR